MINRVLTAGLLAGLLAGLTIAILQHFTTTPLIIAAEAYEDEGHAGGHAALPGPYGFISDALGQAARPLVLAHEGHEQPVQEAWSPKPGLERTLYTGFATIGASAGFAFLLLAGMLVSGGAIDEKRAMIWAVGGFIATGLAPAAGLPPELPGIAPADLVYRQSWWIGTAILTALSLWLFLRSNKLLPRLVAVGFLLLPHIIGAPQPPAFESKVPAELAAHFAAMSLVLQAALWIATGFAAGTLWARSERRG